VTARPIHVAKAELFRVLGHPVRVRILELLREREHSVGELQAALDLDSGGTSQHLAVLRKQGLVESRRDGTSVHYRVTNPVTFDLLESARRILLAHLEQRQSLLHDLTAEPERDGT
jgi:DNA-binding transcriptional ArsR family regulator